ncbi:MAG: hypothetical protein ACJAR6_001204 [Oleispira sp.]
MIYAALKTTFHPDISSADITTIASRAAQGVRNIEAFARYDEYRPWYKPDAGIIHMIPLT